MGIAEGLRLQVLLLDARIRLPGAVASLLVHCLGLCPQQLLRRLALVVGRVERALVEPPLLLGVELHLDVDLLSVTFLRAALLGKLHRVASVFRDLAREGRLGICTLLLGLFVKPRRWQHLLHFDEAVLGLSGVSHGPWLRLLGCPPFLLESEQVLVRFGAYCLAVIHHEVVHQCRLNWRRLAQLLPVSRRGHCMMTLEALLNHGLLLGQLREGAVLHGLGVLLLRQPLVSPSHAP